MNIGQAIQAMRDGDKVARKGWNGKGMFLFLVTGSTVPKENLRNEAKEVMKEHDCPHIEICPHIDMKAADGSVVIGWLASQTDMLANDWKIV